MIIFSAVCALWFLIGGLLFVREAFRTREWGYLGIASIALIPGLGICLIGLGVLR